MSGVDMELAQMTEKLVMDCAALSIANEDGRASLVREFVTAVNRRKYETGGGEEGRRDIMLDLEMEDATQREIVYPYKPGTEPVKKNVLCKFLKPGNKLVIDDPNPVPIGSCIWESEGKGVVVIGVEATWDAKKKEYKLCEVEEAR